MAEVAETRRGTTRPDDWFYESRVCPVVRTRLRPSSSDLPFAAKIGRQICGERRGLTTGSTIIPREFQNATFLKHYVPSLPHSEENSVVAMY